MKNFEVKLATPDGNKININMEITEETYERIVSEEKEKQLKKYLNNPFTYAKQKLKYTDIQETVFETLSYDDKIQVVLKEAENNITAESIYRFLCSLSTIKTI